MNWQTISIVSALITLALIIHTRTLVRWRLRLVGLWLIVAILLVRWAQYRAAWLELAISAGAAIAIYTLWWIIWGRRLPQADDSNIRVWSEDEPF